MSKYGEIRIPHPFHPIHLFNTGSFFLHSGGDSTFKIDCDALTTADLNALAYRAAYTKKLVYGRVIGIPSGGIRFASALDRYITTGSDVTLIADDVYTTGASMDAAAKREEGYPVMGLVIFARSNTPPWIHTLFEMT